MTAPGVLLTGVVAAGLGAAGILLGVVGVANAPLVLLGSAVMLAGAAPRRAVLGLAAGAGTGALVVSVRGAVLPTTTVWDAVTLALLVVVAVAGSGIRLPTSATLVGAAAAFFAAGQAAPLTGLDSARLLPALVAVAWGAAAAAAGLAAGGAFERFPGRPRAVPDREVAR